MDAILKIAQDYGLFAALVIWMVYENRQREKQQREREDAYQNDSRQREQKYIEREEKYIEREEKYREMLTTALSAIEAVNEIEKSVDIIRTRVEEIKHHAFYAPQGGNRT